MAMDIDWVDVGDSTTRGASPASGIYEFQYVSHRGYTHVNADAAGFRLNVIGLAGYDNTPRNGDSRVATVAQGGYRIGPETGVATISSLFDAFAAAHPSSNGGANMVAVSMCGINGVFAGDSAAKLESDWTGHINQVRGYYPSIWHICCGISPTNGQATTAQINGAKAGITPFDIGVGSRVVFVDVNAIPGYNPAIHNVADGTHHTDAGAQLISAAIVAAFVARIAPYLSGTIALPIDPDPNQPTSPITPGVPNIGDWGPGLKDGAVRWFDDVAPGEVEMTTVSMLPATIGQPYAMQFEATGTGVITYQIAGLPTGFAMSDSGLVSPT